MFAVPAPDLVKVTLPAKIADAVTVWSASAGLNV